MGVVQNAIDIKTLGEALAGIGSDLVDVKERSDKSVLWEDSQGYVGKNLVYPENNSITQNHVTFTKNADGSVTVQTTSEGASADTGFIICTVVSNGTINRQDLLSGKTYIMSGCPASGSEDTYYLQWFHYDGSNVIRDTGNGVQVITPDTQSMTGYNNIAIRVQKDTIITEPVVFYPMVRLASVLDDTYEPYLPNNNELVALSTLKSVTSSAADFTAFKAAIAAL